MRNAFLFNNLLEETEALCWCTEMIAYISGVSDCYLTDAKKRNVRGRACRKLPFFKYTARSVAEAFLGVINQDVKDSNKKIMLTTRYKG